MVVPSSGQTALLYNADGQLSSDPVRFPYTKVQYEQLHLSPTAYLLLLPQKQENSTLLILQQVKGTDHRAQNKVTTLEFLMKIIPRQDCWSSTVTHFKLE